MIYEDSEKIATQMQTKKAIETMRIRMIGLGRMGATWDGD